METDRHNRITFYLEYFPIDTHYIHLQLEAIIST